MTTSTNGVISFGVVCDEYTEFPWEEHCIEEWWREVNGFKPLYEPYTTEGVYDEGWSESDPRFDEIWTQQVTWDKENPIPVELENYCSGECPMYAIVVCDLGHTCLRGYPTSFDPKDLVATPRQILDLLSFLQDYNIQYEGEPSWLLTSYWG